MKSAHDAGHSPPCSAEVKNEWSCISTSLCAVMVCTGTALCCHGVHRDSFGAVMACTGTALCHHGVHRDSFGAVMVCTGTALVLSWCAQGQLCAVMVCTGTALLPSWCAHGQLCAVTVCTGTALLLSWCAQGHLWCCHGVHRDGFVAVMVCTYVFVACLTGVEWFRSGTNLYTRVNKNPSA